VRRGRVFGDVEEGVCSGGGGDVEVGRGVYVSGGGN